MSEKENIDDLADVYQYTNYQNKVFINIILVTIILIGAFIAIYFVSSAIIDDTIIEAINMWIGKKVDESLIVTRNFLRDLMLNEEIPKDIRKKIQSFSMNTMVKSKRVDDDQKKFVHIIIKIMIFTTSLLITMVMMLYIRGNFDTMLMWFGTKQKKIAAAGIQENLLLERKQAMIKAGIKITKQELDKERRKIKIDIKKEIIAIRREKKKADIEIRKKKAETKLIKKKEKLKIA